MSDEEILNKAIQKAIEGGWLPYFASFDTNMTKDNIIIRYAEGSSSVNFDYQMKGHIVGVGGYDLEPFSIIYSHDFAKALWGEEEAGTEDFYSPKHNELSGSSWPKMWEYHLREMVIAEDPIQYLGEHLDD